jgi:hypothetical protein
MCEGQALNNVWLADKPQEFRPSPRYVNKLFLSFYRFFKFAGRICWQYFSTTLFYAKRLESVGRKEKVQYF